MFNNMLNVFSSEARNIKSEIDHMRVALKIFLYLDWFYLYDL